LTVLLAGAIGDSSAVPFNEPANISSLICLLETKEETSFPQL